MGGYARQRVDGTADSWSSTPCLANNSSASDETGDWTDGSQIEKKEERKDSSGQMCQRL